MQEKSRVPDLKSSLRGPSFPNCMVKEQDWTAPSSPEAAISAGRGGYDAGTMRDRRGHPAASQSGPSTRTDPLPNPLCNHSRLSSSLTVSLLCQRCRLGARISHLKQSSPDPRPPGPGALGLRWDTGPVAPTALDPSSSLPLGSFGSGRSAHQACSAPDPSHSGGGGSAPRGLPGAVPSDTAAWTRAGEARATERPQLRAESSAPSSRPGRSPTPRVALTPGGRPCPAASPARSRRVRRS